MAAVPTTRLPRLLLATLGVGVVITGIFTVVLVRFRTELHDEIRRTVIDRDAAVLHLVARRQLAEAPPGGGARPDDLLVAILQNAQQEGVLAVAVYDAQGALVRALPASVLFAELTATDYLALLSGEPISRSHPRFQLDRYFSGVDAASAEAPVLEVLLPLAGPGGTRLGFAQYHLDARTLGLKLDALESRLRRQTAVTLTVGVALIAAVLTVAYLGLRRAGRQIAERNARLAHANFELTLAAKTSALGQLVSHLIHNLQGSVAGLRAVMADGASAENSWRSAAGYTERMQAMISEVVALLGDARNGTGAAYELDGRELASLILQRNSPEARTKGVRLVVENRLSGPIDGHRGSLLCLIATNLVQNAIAATGAGYRLVVELTSDRDNFTLSVADQGDGIPDEIRSRLFEPGATGRRGGTGLGLAISRLLARQAGGDLELVSTGSHGTIFRVRVPRPAGEGNPL